MARPSPQLARYRGTTNAGEYLVTDEPEPFGPITGLPSGKTESCLMNASHADEHGLGAFHVAGKQEPREGNRVAF
jgi:hypothetical protein